MNSTQLMFKYANGTILDTEEIEYLENSLIILINEARLSDAPPPIASDDICDSLGLSHESFEMNCIATILDRTKPIKDGICREQHVFHVLLQSRFLYY